eukprot:2629795-Alexandrium_andersonii.AAC.1
MGDMVHISDNDPKLTRNCQPTSHLWTIDVRTDPTHRPDRPYYWRLLHHREQFRGELEARRASSIGVSADCLSTPQLEGKAGCRG